VPEETLLCICFRTPSEAGRPRLAELGQTFGSFGKADTGGVSAGLPRLLSPPPPVSMSLCGPEADS